MMTICSLPRENPAAHGALLSFAKRRGEQGVGLGAALVRRQIICAVEIKRIHGVERHELANIDRVCGRVLERF